VIRDPARQPIGDHQLLCAGGPRRRGKNLVAFEAPEQPVGPDAVAYRPSEGPHHPAAAELAVGVVGALEVTDGEQQERESLPVRRRRG